MPKQRRNRSGFTLLELLVGMAVALIILAASTVAFLAVQSAYYRESRAKRVIETSRSGQAYVEQLLRYAGYGLPPEWTLDFELPADNVAVAGTNATTDDLAFRFRDPFFQRGGRINGGQLELNGTFGTRLPQGQAVLVACPAGLVMAVFRLNADVTAASTQVGVTAETGVGNSGHACLTSAAPLPVVMVVHEKRLRVINQGDRPWLVVFHDHDDPANNPNFDPIAADVENFQVAYVMNRPPAGGAFPGLVLNGGGGNWILGDQPGDGLPTAVGVVAPDYGKDYDDESRYNEHPANVRSVRVSFTARTQLPDTSQPARSAPVSVENFVVANPPPTDGFYRFTTTSAVRLPNQTSRAFFTPPTDPTAVRRFNYNGG